MWTANIFTIFPDIYPGTLAVSNIGKALQNKKWNLNVIDLRKFSNKYGRIDDSPYGGGAGMVLNPEVFLHAYSSMTEEQKSHKKVYLSPRGRVVKQSDFNEMSQLDGITLLCGRYEGVDQRILDKFEFDELSLGDFVLMGGDVGALMIIEGCVRLLPDIVQKSESISEDSFQNGLLEHNQYTKPAIFNGASVPDVLLSGNHEAISKWRLSQSKKITKFRRPNLWAQYVERALRFSKE